MNIKSNVLMALLLVILCSSVAANNSNEEQLGQLSGAKSADQLESKKSDPFELDPIEVTRGNLSFEEELTLRIVRQGFNEIASNKRKDIDKIVCWMSKPVGSRLSELSCARNGDVWASRPDNMRGVGSANSAQYSAVGYGKFMIASHPIARGKLKRILNALSGSDAFDKEFIGLAVKGVKPPRDIPNEEEIERFTKAYVEVNRLSKQGKSEDAQVVAITTENLTLKRYNRIAELIETYASLKEDVASRVKLLR